jgi:hypothetical protein
MKTKATTILIAATVIASKSFSFHFQGMRFRKYISDTLTTNIIEIFPRTVGSENVTRIHSLLLTFEPAGLPLKILFFIL